MSLATRVRRTRASTTQTDAIKSLSDGDMVDGRVASLARACQLMLVWIRNRTSFGIPSPKTLTAFRVMTHIGGISNTAEPRTSIQSPNESFAQIVKKNILSIAVKVSRILCKPRLSVQRVRGLMCTILTLAFQTPIAGL